MAVKKSAKKTLVATLSGAVEVREVARGTLDEKSTALALSPRHARLLLAELLATPYNKKEPTLAAIQVPNGNGWIGYACEKPPATTGGLVLEQATETRYPVYLCEEFVAGTYEAYELHSAINARTGETLTEEEAIDLLIMNAANGAYSYSSVWMPLGNGRSVFLYADTPKWLGEEETDSQSVPKPLGYNAKEDTDREYLLVSDTKSEILQSSTDLNALRKMVGMIRKAGGQVTVFKAMDI